MNARCPTTAEAARDAGQVTRPTSIARPAGQGMNTGPGITFNLAWKLALVQRGEESGARAVSPRYTRRPKRHRATRCCRVGQGTLTDAGHAARFRSLSSSAPAIVASVISSFGFVQDIAQERDLRTSISYRQPALGRAGLGRPAISAAGDRLPDAPLTSAGDGHPTTLFASIRGDRHRLLLFPDSHESAAELAGIAGDVMRDFPNVVTPHVVLKPAAIADGAAIRRGRSGSMSTTSCTRSWA